MLRYITAGESHGKGLVAIMDGMPSGLRLDGEADTFIRNEMRKRMHGYGRGGRMKIEDDGSRIEILSGTRRGLTIGSPISMIILNQDHKIEELADVLTPRPGHADMAGIQKYSLKDARSVLERASARETAMRVAVGAVSKLFLREFGIEILSHVTSIGGVMAVTEGLGFGDIRERTDPAVSVLRCADVSAEKKMCALIDACKEAGDTLGGTFDVLATGVPPGLGSYAEWDRRLDGAIARAMIAIPAVKAVSIGKGVENVLRKGSEVHDPISYDNSSGKFVRMTNNAGGIEGGMSNGEMVVVTGFMKPIATLSSPLDTMDIYSKKKAKASTERSDVCAVSACGVVGEAVIAFELAAAIMDKFGGDSMEEVLRNYKAYIEGIKNI
ncbi:MAG: chorismate synthase [Candidatus Omnitrophica bacterium]|nr:chorismate synthase [Candidatus Omnitrophota bacterium]MDD5487627.1 chorismate synthase [Candidatus Omnitrophota bacterium]